MFERLGPGGGAACHGVALLGLVCVCACARARVRASVRACLCARVCCPRSACITHISLAAWRALSTKYEHDGVAHPRAESLRCPTPSAPPSQITHYPWVPQPSPSLPGCCPH